MNEKVKETNNTFQKFFKKKDYRVENSVEISSGFDNSVAFIGSAISVMKPLLLQDEIDENGNVLAQKSIRTRSAKRLYIPEILEWSSYFDALGVLVNYERLEQLIIDTIEYLHICREYDYSDICIRISSRDKDALKIISQLDDVSLEIDTKPENYYNHKYGLDNFGIYGRNFNIALRDWKTKEFKDIGNVVIIESHDKKYGAEFAVGVNALIMRQEGLQSSLEASTMVDVVDLNTPAAYKFADCLAVVSHLAYENIEMNRKDRSKIYLYHKYLKALREWQKILEINNAELLNLVEKYILLEYNIFEKEKIEDNLRLILK